MRSLFYGLVVAIIAVFTMTGTSVTAFAAEQKSESVTQSQSHKAVKHHRTMRHHKMHSLLIPRSLLW